MSLTSGRLSSAKARSITQVSFPTLWSCWLIFSLPRFNREVLSCESIEDIKKDTVCTSRQFIDRAFAPSLVKKHCWSVMFFWQHLGTKAFDLCIWVKPTYNICWMLLERSFWFLIEPKLSNTDNIGRDGDSINARCPQNIFLTTSQHLWYSSNSQTWNAEESIMKYTLQNMNNALNVLKVKLPGSQPLFCSVSPSEKEGG